MDVGLLICLVVGLPVLAIFGDKPELENITKEREAFERQKTKFKLIEASNKYDLEKEVNRFIRDKKIVNISYDTKEKVHGSLFHWTDVTYIASIVYENI